MTLSECPASLAGFKHWHTSWASGRTSGKPWPLVSVSWPGESHVRLYPARTPENIYTKFVLVCSGNQAQQEKRVRPPLIPSSQIATSFSRLHDINGAMESSHRTNSPSREKDDSTSNRPSKRQKMNASTEVGLMREASAQDSASFVGSASGIHFIRSVYGALNAGATSSTLTGQTPDGNIVPGEDDRLNASSDHGQSKPLWQPDEVDSRDQAHATASFGFDELLDWSISYFDIWHPPFPFLHAPTLLERLETLAQNGVDAVSSLDLVTIKSIISISISDKRQSNTSGRAVPKHLVFSSFPDALESVQAVMTNPATIQALQAAVSVQLFLVSMLRLNAASRLGGLIIRVAFQLGLHRCPVRFSSFTLEEQQVQKTPVLVDILH